VNQYLEHSYTIHGDNVAEDDRNEYVLDRPRVEEESESESDIYEEFENYESLSGLSRVQNFMISSTAFSRFRENLRGFVRQDFMSKVNSLIRKLTKDARSYPRLGRSASKLNRLGLAFLTFRPRSFVLGSAPSRDLPPTAGRRR
jgi:hypothetical protein